MDIKTNLNQILRDLDTIEYAGLNILADTLDMVDSFIGCPANNGFNTKHCSLCLNADICKAIKELSLTVTDKICEIEGEMFKD